MHTNPDTHTHAQNTHLARDALLGEHPEGLLDVPPPALALPLAAVQRAVRHALERVGALLHRDDEVDEVVAEWGDARGA